MANNEFNLSVLGDFALMDTPIKDCLTVFSLIKEEIDIMPTEDEFECEKYVKPPQRVTKRKSSDTSFRSPYKKKYSLKLKSPSVLLSARNRKSYEAEKHNARENRRRSLGRAKPRRSCPTNHRRHSSSISHSENSAFSDNGDNSTAETSKDFSLTDLSAERNTVDSLNPDDANSTSSKGKSTSLAITDSLETETTYESHSKSSRNVETPHPKTNDIEPTITAVNDLQNNSVESNYGSQKNSEELSNNNRRISIEFSDKSRKNSVELDDENQKNSAESSDEKQNFSLILSPDSKSSSSTLRREATTSSAPKLRKRKAVCRVSPLKDFSHELEDSKFKNEASALPLRQKRRRISVDNPLEDLSQEIDHFIRSNDLIEIPDSESETVSFTFEPIKLFNELEDSKQRESNGIFDNSLFSPATNSSEKNALALDNDHSGDDLPPAKSKADRTSAESPKTSVEKSTARKTAIGKEISPPSDRSKNLDASLSTSKKNESAKSKAYKRKSSLTKTVKREKTRTSSRLEGKERINMSLSDSENDENFSEEDGASIVEDVAAAKKKLALSTKIIDKLRETVIHLRHEVPPQHKIENRAGSRPLSFEQQKRFVELAPLNKGRYTPAEDETIRKNWKTFCKDHDWNPEDYKPFLLLRHGAHLIMSSLEERRKFVQLLANGLPNRPLYSVYNRFRLLYDKYDTAGSRYTKKEDAQIIAYMKYHEIDSPQACERSFSELAKVMNRSRTSIWKRHVKLVKKNSLIEDDKRAVASVAWDLPLVGKFIATLLDVSLSDELIELKDTFLPRAVWLKMEEKMKVKFDVMQRFWGHKLHMQLFAPEPILLNGIRIKLIEYMHEAKIADSKELKWDNVVKSFNGYTASFLRYVFNHLKLSASLALNSRDFNEILQWLHDKKINELKYSLKDKCLPRIIYKDRKAEFFADDLTNARLTLEGHDDD